MERTRTNPLHTSAMQFSTVHTHQKSYSGKDGAANAGRDARAAVELWGDAGGGGNRRPPN